MTILNDDLFASFEQSTRDVNEACLLPPELYSSNEWFEFEKQAIFARAWLCVGRFVDQGGDNPQIPDGFTRE